MLLWGLVQMLRKTPGKEVIWCCTSFWSVAHLTHTVWAVRRIKTRSLLDLWTSHQSKKNWLFQRGPGSHQQLLCVRHYKGGTQSCCRLHHHQITLSLSCLSSILDLQQLIHIHLWLLMTLLTINISSPCSLPDHVWGAGVGVGCEQV